MEEPGKKPNRLKRWWALPIFVALAGFELSAPHINGKRPDWIVVGLCGAGIAWLLLLRPLLDRPTRKD